MMAKKKYTKFVTIPSLSGLFCDFIGWIRDRGFHATCMSERNGASHRRSTAKLSHPRRRLAPNRSQHSLNSVKCPLPERVFSKWKLATCALLCSMLILQTGCYDWGTEFTYGKANDRSINGVSVFANLLRERGHSVSNKRRLSKRVNKFDTIFWAPDNPDMPPENVVAWLENWLANGNQKVLIYVGRSYDATLAYYRGKLANATPEDRDNWQRELGDVLVQQWDYGVDWRANLAPTSGSFWFESETTGGLDSSAIAGPWAEGIDASATDLECEILLKPIDDYNLAEDALPQLSTGMDPETGEYIQLDYEFTRQTFRDDELEVTELLTVDGKPFAFEVSSQSAPGRKVIVISNGSFLLNYPLLKPENRKLASRVADNVVGDVVVLESNWSWPKIGGAANDPALRWTWVGRAPMSYIVPHFLFWGVLYCFVFYPNFGRPKRIQFHPPKAFRSHVKAVASILGRSKEKSWARQMVNAWLNRTNKKS